ncbi:MAG: diaminopropionate ammonia-lyase [Ilumatobacteraceae bacterium]
MAVHANPLHVPGFTVAPPEGEPPRAFHRRLPGYASSPLHSAGSLAGVLGVEAVWVKDESSRLGLPAFKIIGASWAVYVCLERRRGRPFDTWGTLDELSSQVAELGALTLATATDGNHGRAVAHFARLLGLASRVRVPANTVAARKASIAAEGADVTVSDGTYDQAVAEVAAWASEDTLVISDTSWPGYEDVPNWIVDGYSTIFAEIDEQLDLQHDAPGGPTVVFVPVGVGALAAAVVDRYRRAGASAVRIVAVEPTSAACVLASLLAGHVLTIPGEQDSIMAGLNCGTPSPVAWPRVSAGTDHVVTVSDDDARDAMRLLASAGIVSGESGAAALAGAVQYAAAGLLRADDRVLLLSTEGATDPLAYRRIVDAREGVAVR